MNIGTLGTLIAFMRVSGLRDLVAMLALMLLVVLVLALAMKISCVLFRRCGFIGLLLILGGFVALPLLLFANFGVMIGIMSRHHSRASSNGHTVPVAVQSSRGLVQSDLVVLTLRRGKELPRDVSGVDLALTLKQLAHDMALTDSSKQQGQNPLPMLVKRTDDETVTLGDLVSLRRVRRHHQGTRDEGVIELRSRDATTLELFSETATALAERIDRETEPTVILEVDDRVLRLRIARGNAKPPVSPWLGLEAEFAEDEFETVREEAMEAMSEALSEAELDLEDVDEIISTALNGAFEGLAHAKRAKARLKKHIDQKEDTPAEDKPQQPDGEQEESSTEKEEETLATDDGSGDDEATQTETASTESDAASLPVDATESFDTATSSEIGPESFSVTPGLTEQGAYHVTVHAGPHTNLSDCEAELAEKRHAALIDYAKKLLGTDAEERIDFDRFEFQYMIHERRLTDTIDHPEYGPMYNLYAELTFDRQIQQQLRSEYHDSVVGDRLKFTGVASGSILLMLSAVFGYLKLDTLTRGYYRGRLGMMAGALIVAAVAAVVAII